MREDGDDSPYYDIALSGIKVEKCGGYGKVHTWVHLRTMSKGLASLDNLEWWELFYCRYCLKMIEVNTTGKTIDT